jgi:hypothetical protein
MLHIVKWIERNYPNQSEMMIHILLMLSAAALIIGLSIFFLT